MSERKDPSPLPASASAAFSSPSSSTLPKRDRRRGSLDAVALAKAVQNTQRLHDQQQAAAHLQQQTPARFGSPSLSPAPTPSLPSSPSRQPSSALRHSQPPQHNSLPHSLAATQPLPSPSPPLHSYQASAHAHPSLGLNPVHPGPAHGGQPDFPFPSLLSLNRARLLHLLDYQIRLSSQPDDESGQAVDPESTSHYRALQAAIRTLNCAGSVFSLGFIAGSSMSEHFLTGIRDAKAGDASATNARLTAIQLMEVLHSVRSNSPNLALPSELPPALLDAGILYRPDEERAQYLQLSPFVYHRALALLSLMFNLHLHQLVLSRVLHLIQGVDVHLDWWLAHQRVRSLSKPYRLWQFIKWKWAIHGSGPADSKLHSSASFSRSGGLSTPRKPQRATSQQSATSAAAPGASASQNPYARWDRIAARNVRELVTFKKRWTQRCGKIASRMHQLQEFLAASFSRSAVGAASTAAPAAVFHQQLAMSEHYLSRLYSYVVVDEDLDEIEDDDVAARVRFTPAHARANSASSNSRVPPGSIQAKIFAFYSQFAQFEHLLEVFEAKFSDRFEEQIQRRRKPHHLFQNWHYYATMAVVLGAGAWYGLRHQDEARKLFSGALESTRFFLQEHLVEPLTNIVETTRKTFHDRALFGGGVNTLEQSKANLSLMLSEFAGNHARELAANESRSKAEYLQSISTRAQLQDMNLVMKTYEREIQHPIFSLLFGDLMRGLLIQIQKVKVDTEAAMLAMDQILKSNTVNFNILATIPFLLLCYVGADLLNKYCFQGTWGSRRVQDSVRQSKKILAELEQIFIIHLPSMSPAAAASAAPRRPAVHSRFSTVTMDEFASLCSQEQEDEDEALRLVSPKDDGAVMHGAELFGGNDADEDANEDSGDEADGVSQLLPPLSQSSPYESPSRDPRRHLFSSANSSSAPSASSLFLPSASTSALALDSYAYGNTLLLLHKLSSKFASLPLTSAYTPRQLSSTPTGAHDPRIILQKDLILLSSAQLSPQQKLYWLGNMRHAYDFLRSSR